MPLHCQDTLSAHSDLPAASLYKMYKKSWACVDFFIDLQALHGFYAKNCPKSAAWLYGEVKVCFHNVWKHPFITLLHSLSEVNIDFSAVWHHFFVKWFSNLFLTSDTTIDLGTLRDMKNLRIEWVMLKQTKLGWKSVQRCPNSNWPFTTIWIKIPNRESVSQWGDQLKRCWRIWKP